MFSCNILSSFTVNEMHIMCIVRGTFYTTCTSLCYAYQGSDSRKGNEPGGWSIQAAPEDPRAENSTWTYSLRCGHTLCPWWSDRQQQWISEFTVLTLTNMYIISHLCPEPSLFIPYLSKLFCHTLLCLTSRGQCWQMPFMQNQHCVWQLTWRHSTKWALMMQSIFILVLISPDSLCQIDSA